VLRLDVLVGVALTRKALSVGSETTIVAVHISAVHQRSKLCQISGLRSVAYCQSEHGQSNDRDMER
jgi:hypothetical protein